MWNFIQGQMQESKSWLMWARMNDLDLIRELDEAQGGEDAPKERTVRGFETFQFGATEQLLAALIKVMSTDDKTPIIQPHTAWDDLREEKGHAKLQATRMTVTRVSAEEYARLMADAGSVVAYASDEEPQDM